MIKAKVGRIFEIVAKIPWNAIAAIAIGGVLISTAIFDVTLAPSKPVPTINVIHVSNPNIKPKVKFETSEGTLTFELWPDVAPHHVDQILKLIHAGLYNNSIINRIEPGFIVYFAGEYEHPSLDSKAQMLVKQLPLEVNQYVKHERGVLSMARYDDPNSATTAFSVLLGPAPHLDYQYTIFGKLVDGYDVLDKLAAKDPYRERVSVKRAEIVPTNVAGN